MEAVDRVPPPAGARHEIEIAQDPELVGNGGLSHAHRTAELALAAGALAEAADDLNPALGPRPGHEPRDLARRLRVTGVLVVTPCARPLRSC